jgi:acyl-CoA thioesterase YciA
MDEEPQDHKPQNFPLVRTIAMPADTNPAGDIFGGWLMAQMDLAAGNMAARTARGRSVTIAVDAMSFLRPVKVGDEVSLFASLLRTGRTSMQIFVEAWRRDRYTDISERVTHATFTFVALDENGRPRPLLRDPAASPPPAKPSSSETVK